MYSYEEVVERFVKALESMEGEELAELANREFGMGIKYVGDDIFEDITADPNNEE